MSELEKHQQKVIDNVIENTKNPKEDSQSMKIDGKESNILYDTTEEALEGLKMGDFYKKIQKDTSHPKLLEYFNNKIKKEIRKIKKKKREAAKRERRRAEKQQTEEAKAKAEKQQTEEAKAKVEEEEELFLPDGTWKPPVGGRKTRRRRKKKGKRKTKRRRKTKRKRKKKKRKTKRR